MEENSLPKKHSNERTAFISKSNEIKKKINQIGPENNNPKFYEILHDDLFSLYSDCSKNLDLLLDIFAQNIENNEISDKIEFELKGFQLIDQIVRFTFFFFFSFIKIIISSLSFFI